MFTGIVEGEGRVTSVAPSKRGGRRLEIAPPPGFGRLSAGESVSVSGVCLTALEAGRRLCADLSPETLRRSTLGRLAAGDRVNLERALRWGDRLSGHFVMGHVDAVARLLEVVEDGNSWTLRVAIPSGLSPLIAEKGSVALDGVSLTVASRAGRAFTVAMIPETRRRTTLGRAASGTLLNLEADVFARYGRLDAMRRVRSDMPKSHDASSGGRRTSREETSGGHRKNRGHRSSRHRRRR